jgi:hypothetical protein
VAKQLGIPAVASALVTSCSVSMIIGSCPSTMEPGAAKLPRAPISGKAKGERPQIAHLA